MASEGGQRGTSTFCGLYLSFRPLAAPAQRVRAAEVTALQCPPEHILCRDPKPQGGGLGQPCRRPLSRAPPPVLPHRLGGEPRWTPDPSRPFVPRATPRPQWAGEQGSKPGWVHQDEEWVGQKPPQSRQQGQGPGWGVRPPCPQSPSPTQGSERSSPLSPVAGQTRRSSQQHSTASTASPGDLCTLPPLPHAHLASPCACHRVGTAPRSSQ